MLKSDAIKKKITAKVEETESYRNAGKLAEAKNAAQEILKLKDELDVALTLEKTEDEEFFASAVPADNKPSGDNVETLRNRAFNKLLFKKFGRLSDEERQAYFNVSGTPGQPGQIESTVTKGGYLVPEEQLATIREYRKAYVQLKSYCHVVQANATSGKWPTLGEESGLLLNFSELTDIRESDFEFGQANYEIADYGDIIPVSNQLIADANINIMSIIGQRLARKAVNTENSLILTKLGALNASATAITDFKGFNKALIKDLDPIYLSNAKIYTNQDGFLWLSNLVDSTQRPLLQPDVTAPDTYLYKGKPVVVVPNNILASDTTANTAPFYIGNLADYLMFFERQGVEIAVSTEYLFAKYGTALRCVVRFGAAVDDKDAMKAYTVAI